MKFSKPGHVSFTEWLFTVVVLIQISLVNLIIIIFLICRPRVMEEGSEVMEDIVFRGVEFSVKIEVDKGLLIVEISDSVTADQWRGDFDPACK